jgi:Rod binding domain-containing protein
MTDGITLHADAAGLGTPDPQRTGNLKEAAGKFESLLIAQMLKSAREADSGGWSGEAADPSSSSMMDMAEQQLADLLGSNGSLGLARMVVTQLGKKD